jgi:hypothetical protein
VTWNFKPGERWLSLELPAEFGGGRRAVEVHGAYTLAAVKHAVPAPA